MKNREEFLRPNLYMRYLREYAAEQVPQHPEWVRDANAAIVAILGEKFYSEEDTSLFSSHLATQMFRHPEAGEDFSLLLDHLVNSAVNVAKQPLLWE